MAREQTRIPYLVEIVLESASGRRQERISDLSAGGCFVDSIALMTEGEPIAFEMVLPDGGSLKFTGRVTYVLAGVGFGVRFTEVSDDQRAFIESAMSSVETAA